MQQPPLGSHYVPSVLDGLRACHPTQSPRTIERLDKSDAMFGEFGSTAPCCATTIALAEAQSQHR
ncbi:MAG: hypothetical protein WKH64_07870 [Chloroflexia bacterium]